MSEVILTEEQKQQIEKSLLDTNLDYYTILEKSNKLGDIIQLIEDKTIRIVLLVA